LKADPCLVELATLCSRRAAGAPFELRTRDRLLVSTLLDQTPEFVAATEFKLFPIQSFDAYDQGDGFAVA